MMHPARRFIAVVGLVLGLSGPAFARDGGREDVDHLELATVLVADGHYDRASAVLSSVDPAIDDVAVERFYLLRGLVRLNQSLYSQAAADLERAIAAARERAAEDDRFVFDPLWYVYLGQAHFFADDPAASIAAFDAAGERAREIRSTYTLRAEAYRKLARYKEAWSVLAEGAARYPDDAELLRRRTFLAIELQLYRVAADLGRAYLRRVDAKPEDYLAIGSALQRAGNTEDALRFLELARLHFPSSAALASELAKLYRGRGMYQTAALMLERASLMGSQDLTLDAAELFRQAGEPVRALALNARVADSEKRLRQRLGILLELGRFEMVAAMEKDLKRVGLLDVEQLRYAVAYAHFKTGAYDHADRLLARIKDPTVFRQATELRKAMSECRTEPWRC